MCTVSMIGDHYREKWGPLQGQGGLGGLSGIVTISNTHVSQAEFDQLKREVMEMKALLIKAKIYDEATGQKHCEQEEKIKILKAVADAVGISLEEVFGAINEDKQK